MNNRLAVHTIIDTDNLGFSPIQYSKFKYGETSIASEYGKELFDFFTNFFFQNENNKNRKLIVYSSPFSNLPTSSYFMTKSFYQNLERYYLFHNLNIDLLYFGKVDRCQTYVDDYGSMSAKERYELIKNDTYSIQQRPPKDAILFFLDDISITGSHQIVLENLLKEQKINNESYFLYYATLENSSVDPTFENVLNYAFVNNLDNLLQILKSESFENTTRTTKKILSLKETEIIYLFKELVINQKKHIFKKIISDAFNNNYHLIEDYKMNFDFIHSLVNET